MTPVDKASEQEKESSEEETDLRQDWEAQDIEDARRKPNLEEIEKDPSSL